MPLAGRAIYIDVDPTTNPNLFPEGTLFKTLRRSCDVEELQDTNTFTVANILDEKGELVSVPDTFSGPEDITQLNSGRVIKTYSPVSICTVKENDI